MPKLCRMRLSVSLPFSWPITATAPAAEAADAGDDRRVLGEFPVAGERGEILDQPLGVVDEMRPVRVAGDLRLLPGREPGVDVGKRLVGPRFQAVDLLVDGDGVTLVAERLELLDLALEVGNRLFEVEIGAHPLSRTSGPGRSPPPLRAGRTAGKLALGRGVSSEGMCRREVQGRRMDLLGSQQRASIRETTEPMAEFCRYGLICPT